MVHSRQFERVVILVGLGVFDGGDDGGSTGDLFGHVGGGGSTQQRFISDTPALDGEAEGRIVAVARLERAVALLDSDSSATPRPLTEKLKDGS